MSDLASLDRVLRTVYGDPKVKAQMEWFRDYDDSFGAQLMGQVPRFELEHYAATGQHANPDRRLTFHEPENEMPDFDWWEPRYDQPWRRQQARYRDAGL